MQAIGPCDEEARAIEHGATICAVLSRIEFFNVKFRTLTVCVYHILRPCTVATHQILDAMYGLFLKDIFYPCTAPTEDAVDRAFTMLLPLEMYSDLGHLTLKRERTLAHICGFLLR